MTDFWHCSNKCNKMKTEADEQEYNLKSHGCQEDGKGQGNPLMPSNAVVVMFNF